MTITTPEYFEYFTAWRFIYDNYLRDEILGYKKKCKEIISTD
jgi:hypothetical protein